VYVIPNANNEDLILWQHFCLFFLLPFFSKLRWVFGVVFGVVRVGGGGVGGGDFADCVAMVLVVQKEITTKTNSVATL